MKLYYYKYLTHLFITLIILNFVIIDIVDLYINLI